MASIRQDVTCPHCKEKLRFRFKDELNKDDIADIIDRSFFKHTCKYCNKEFVIDHPVTLTGDNFIIYYTPTKDESVKDESNKEIKRVCDTFDDFKEKLLILNDGLNDLVIEFVKCYIHDKLAEDEKLVDIIRYSGMNDEQLEFCIIDDYQNVGINKALYDGILNKAKIKLPKEAILVDFNTFRKYIKI